MFVSRLIMPLLAFLLIVAPAAQAQDDNVIDTTFMLTFVPNVQFSPIYVGQEKGYFTEAGYNITVEYVEEPLAVMLIAANERQFGIISGEQVLAARAKNMPVVSIYEWFQRYPIGIATGNNSGIESIEDLKGRRVGIPGRFGASYTALTAQLFAHNLTENDIDLQEIGFNSADIICIGAIEATVSYINNEPLQIRDRAARGECGDIENVIVFPLSDSLDMVSNGLITNETLINEAPERVLAMTEALDRALYDTIINPAEAYLINVDYVENLPLSDELRAALEAAAEAQRATEAEKPTTDQVERAAQRRALLDALSKDFTAEELLQFRILLATIDMWDAEHLGYSDGEAWDNTLDILLQMNLIDAPLDTAEAYTNDFLPAHAAAE